MKKVSDLGELEMICGGSSLSGTLLNALTNIIELLQDAGRSFGAALRRISENNLCSLE